jgi:biopolymer transport protein ExbD/biopolymer transport protein TolR
MRRVRLQLPATGRPNSDINVTPLVDVVLVLLIIFMVLTPLLEKDIEVQIPNTQEVPQELAVLPDQIVVSLDAQGRLSINSHAVAREAYVDELRPLLANRRGSERLVFFAPDDKANYGLLVAALDGAKQAGASVLGMVTEPLPAPPRPEAAASPPPSR